MNQRGRERSPFEPEPPPLDEQAARLEIEANVRDELEAQYRSELTDERVTAQLALRIWTWVIFGLLFLVGVPLLGLVIGLAVRAFRWAAGIW